MALQKRYAVILAPIPYQQSSFLKTQALDCEPVSGLRLRVEHDRPPTQPRCLSNKAKHRVVRRLRETRSGTPIAISRVDQIMPVVRLVSEKRQVAIDG